jgi:predicted nucleotidyltransferase
LAAGQAALSEVVLYDFSVIEGLASKIKAGMNCRAFLVGSYAWGRPNEESDVDLAVVVPDSDYDGRTHIKARKLTEHGLIPIDVLAFRESTFATSAQGSLSFEIKTKGGCGQKLGLVKQESQGFYGVLRG